jgi:hypothetical protein
LIFDLFDIDFTGAVFFGSRNGGFLGPNGIWGKIKSQGGKSGPMVEKNVCTSPLALPLVYLELPENSYIEVAEANWWEII